MLLHHDSTQIHSSVEYVKMCFACLWAGKKISYIATPISTGFRYIDWYKQEGRDLLHDREKFRASHYIAVIEPNKQIALHATLQLARCNREPFCPAELYFADWSHGDYMALYSYVIQHHASELFFLNGWPASLGSVMEFCQAVELNRPCFDNDGAVLDKKQSLKTIKDTVPLLAAADLDVEPFTRVIGRLEWLLD